MMHGKKLTSVWFQHPKAGFTSVCPAICGLSSNTSTGCLHITEQAEAKLLKLNMLSVLITRFFLYTGSLWHGIKQKIGLAHSHKDEKAEEHRDGFTALIKELKNSLRPDGLLLTATVLPNVDASVGILCHQLLPK
jgi:hypothetical protein